MHLNITYESLAKIIEGKLISKTPKAIFKKLTIDTRTLQTGDAYWVIKGARLDGHDFIDEAIKKGAVLIICEIGRANLAQNQNISFIEVKDTLKALQALALYHRQNSAIKIAAITGSNGKSTTKQMLMSLTSAAAKTCASAGNFNNQIGLPLSLLEITSKDVFGVFELGASHKGDIDEIASLVRPDVAVITNISPAHLEFFGDMETIYQTKTEIIKWLNTSGFLVYNGDDILLRRLKTAYRGKAISFGFGDGMDLKIDDGGDNFAFTYKGAKFSFPLKLERHNKLNAAAACAAAIALGLYKDQLERGLSTYTPMPMRLEEHQKGKTKFILDYYNANPASMENALDFLVKNSPPHTAVLGDMRELGKYSKKYHEDLARSIISHGIKTVFLAGEEMRPAYDILAKDSSVMVTYALDKNDLLADIKAAAKEGGTVLIKASRALNFEDIYKNL
ncbi:MAG: UDP-N-acetylmuramoyl-tripeptide--D-alanyl-D-alanine ligase [Elusimicrobiota bacterium]|jgi:UDP-N-acetylmuramoyl-tripeptide--D-alanyl-D-alanine ligase|nr:UDP-N-acetylmuramoyl-tripeptide--D-alanyl-D-alanine ligase [Elusimicrobiota bacterium]